MTGAKVPRVPLLISYMYISHLMTRLAFHLDYSIYI